MSSESLFRYRRPGLTFTLLPDRIEVLEGTGTATQHIILLQDIKKVELRGLVPKVTITTTDGQQAYLLGADNGPAVLAIEKAIKGLQYLATTGPMPRQVRVKEYKDAKDFEADAAKLLAAGWHLEDQVAQNGHVNVGRTATGAILTGGLSLPPPFSLLRLVYNW